MILIGLHEIVCRAMSVFDSVGIGSFNSEAFGSWAEQVIKQTATSSTTTPNPWVDMRVCYLSELALSRVSLDDSAGNCRNIAISPIDCTKRVLSANACFATPNLQEQLIPPNSWVVQARDHS